MSTRIAWALHPPCAAGVNTPLTTERFSLKGARGRHSFARHRHSSAGKTSAKETKGTKGLILSGGWRYDLHGWFIDTFRFRGQGRALRQRAITLARLQPRQAVLDVGRRTVTLAMEVAPRVGR